MKKYLTKCDEDFWDGMFDWHEIRVNKKKLQQIKGDLYMYKGIKDMLVYQVDPQKDKDFKLRFPGKIHWLSYYKECAKYVEKCSRVYINW